jgi:hypothetical protein
MSRHEVPVSHIRAVPVKTSGHKYEETERTCMPMKSRGIGLPLGGTEVNADDGSANPTTIAPATKEVANE